MIACKICNNEFKTLTGSHLATHDITVAKYKKTFRVKYIHSKEARRKIGISKLGHKYNVGRPFRLKSGTRKRLTGLLIKFNRSKRGRRLKEKQMKGNQRAKGHHKTKEFRKHQSRTMKLLWQNVKYRRTILKKRIKALKKNSFKKLVSQRFTSLWKDPKWRRKMLKARAK